MSNMDLLMCIAGAISYVFIIVPAIGSAMNCNGEGYKSCICTGLSIHFGILSLLLVCSFILLPIIWFSGEAPTDAPLSRLAEWVNSIQVGGNNEL